MGSAGLITLLTDFGSRDGYVASIKGVILRLAPATRLVDISHEISPQNIEQAAYVLGTVCPRYPAGTVHIAVVDPGVGSERRALVVEVLGQCFVAPDNGILSSVLGRNNARVYAIDQERFRRPAPGSTFDGRDLFGPIGAWISLGALPAAFGSEITDPIRSTTAAPTRTCQRVDGCVIHIDRFGNAITNLGSSEVALVAATGPAAIQIRAATLSLVRCYADVSIGEIGAMINSDGRLEIFVRNAAADGRLGIQPGDSVVLCPMVD